MNDETSPVQRLMAQQAGELGRENIEGPQGQQHGCYSEHPRDLRMLDLRLADGTCRARPYHYLEDICIDQTRRQITMMFPGSQVTVVGLRLWPVYQALTSHRVGYLSISPSSPAVSMRPESLSDGTPSITSIEVISED